MVEVFKTNLNDVVQSIIVAKEIERSFPYYEVNFDLDDCDRILRIKNRSGSVEIPPVVLLLEQFGYYAEVLPDTPPVKQRPCRGWWQLRPQVNVDTV